MFDNYSGQVREVKLGKEMLDKVPACERDLTYLNRVLLITLQLACHLTRNMPEETSAEHLELHQNIYRLVRIGARGKQVKKKKNLKPLLLKGEKSEFISNFVCVIRVKTHCN